MQQVENIQCVLELRTSCIGTDANVREPVVLIMIVLCMLGVGGNKWPQSLQSEGSGSRPCLGQRLVTRTILIGFRLMYVCVCVCVCVCARARVHECECFHRPHCRTLAAQKYSQVVTYHGNTT
jgi:hypothetical protein